MEHKPTGRGSSRFGIYLNAQDRQVVRINSPYWFPEEPEWVYLTPEVNATLMQIRQMAADRSLINEPESLTWGRLPAKD